MKSRLVSLVIGMSVLLAARFAAACPSCVDSMAANGSTGGGGGAPSMAGGVGGSMALGYYYSIVFMLVMLFGVTGAIIYAIWRQARVDARMPLPDGGSPQ